jgi:hypothetical protein
MQKLLKVLGLTLLLLSFAAVSYGQAVSGDLVGTVTDKTGAVVANAQVDVQNLATGLKLSTTTTVQGGYHISNLPSGHYAISVSAAGLKGGVKDIEVAVNKASTANVTVNIASEATVIEVSAAATVLDTQTANIQTTFEAKEVTDLAASSGTSGVLNLALYDAGVASSGGMGAGSGPSVSGQRPRNNNFTIEGVDNNDKSTTGPLVQIPNDAVEEFTVLQNQFSPEFGHSSGGQFNQTIKGGSNKFHGKAYEYFQNRNLNAQDVLAAGQPMARYDNNRFGGQLGGPVIKNKVFFFSDWEYNPVGQATSAPPTFNVPTSTGLTSLAAAYPGTNLNVYKKYVPNPTNVDTNPIDQVCADPACANTVQTGNLQFIGAAFVNTLTAVNSVDFNPSSKDQVRVRYIYEKQNASDTSATLPAFWSPVPYRYHIFTLGEYHNFTPTLNNEFRLGFNRYYNITGAGSASYPGLSMFPNITIDDTAYLQIGPDPNAPQGTIQNTYQATDNISWVHGKHTLKFGGEYREYISPQAFTQRVRGDYEWSTLASFLSDASPDIFAERSMGNQAYYGNQQAVYLFANDEYRVTPSLTLSAGLRWELTTVPLSQSKFQPLNAIASVPGLINFGAPKKQLTNFAPRVGFAYAPASLPNTSIRGGFAMAYDVLYDNLGILSLPPELQQTCDVGPTQTANCFWKDAGFLANGGLPSIAPGPFSNAADARASTGAFTPNQALPYTVTWNLGFQHVFNKNYTLEVRYVGTHGVHLPVQDRLNISSPVTAAQHLPTYMNQSDAVAYAAGATAQTLTLAQLQGIGYYQTALGNAGFNSANLVGFMPYGGSKYNGLQTQLSRAFSNGLQFKMAWTWSHAFDNSTADVASTYLTPRRAQDFQNYGKEWAVSALDRRHRVSAEIIYDLPYFKNSHNWFAKNGLGNWQFAPTYIFESPEYATVQSGVDANLNGDQWGDRAILNPNGVGKTGSGVTAVKDLAGDTVAYYANNPSARYVVASYGAYSNIPRNTLPLYHINNFDIAALKRFNITEHQSFEFACHAYNMFNHPQPIAGSLNDVLSVSTASSNERGVAIPSSSNFGHPEKVFSSNPRSLQLVVKYNF